MQNNTQFTVNNNQILIRSVIEHAKRENIPLNALKTAEIYLNDVIVTPDDWESVEAKKGDNIVVYFSINATGLAVAGAIGSAISSFAATTIGGIIISTAVSVGVSYVVSSIMNFFTREQEQTRENQAGKMYTLTSSSNSQRPYEYLPIVIGSTRVVPDYAIAPYQQVIDNIQYINHLFVVSVGQVDVTDVRQDTTPIISSVGGDIEYYVYSGWSGQPFKWVNKAMATTSYNYKLDAVIFPHETPADTELINIVLNFPSGIYAQYTPLLMKPYINDLKVINLDTQEIVINASEGNRYELEQTTLAGYTYTLTLSKYNTATNTTSALPKGRYRVEIGALRYELWYITTGVYIGDYKLINGEITYYIAGLSGNTKIYGDSYVVEVQAQQDKPPITYTGQIYTLIEMRAKASERLNGALNTINCLATLQGRNEDYSLVTTSNIAKLARRLLTDKNIIQTAGDVPLNAESFAAFEQHCEKYGFSANGVETGGRTLGVVLSEMLEVAQAYISMRNGEYVITYDNPDGDTVDVITSRNSANMSIKQSKQIKAVDGLRVMFYNKNKDYAQDEILVHEDGVTPANIEKLDALWVDNYELAYKIGMLTLARVRLRSKIIAFSTDWRAIDYVPGDKILVQHPSFFLGVGTQGKVVGYQYNDNNYVEAVILDQFYNTELGKLYSLKDGTKYSVTFWDIRPYANEETQVLYFQVPILEAQAPRLDAMVTLGESGKAGIEVLIKEITRNADFTADISCIPSAKGYYDVIDGDIPPYESALTFPSYYDRGKPNKAELINYVADETTMTIDSRGELVGNAVLSMRLQDKTGVYFSYYRVMYYERGTLGFPVRFPKIINEYDKYTITLPELVDKKEYGATVWVVSTSGVWSEPASFTIYNEGATNPPPPPDELYLNGNLLEIKNNTPPIDLRGYEVKIATNLIDSYDQSALITNPINLDGIVDLTPYINITKRVYVKAVDAIGLKSEEIFININLGEDVTRNLYDTISEVSKGWSGSIVDGNINAGNQLISNLPIQTLYNGVDVETIYNGIDIKTIYSNMPLAVSYTYEIDINELYHGSFMRVSADIVQGEIKNVYYSRCVYVGDELVYSTPVLLTSYRITSDDVKIRITVNFDNQVALICNDISTLIDFDDKPLMIIEDVKVVGANFLVEVPQNYFKRIRNVSASIQYDEGFNDAYSVKVVSKGTIVNGYVTDGVRVTCYDANGAVVNGILDLSIQGF